MIDLDALAKDLTEVGIKVSKGRSPDRIKPLPFTIHEDGRVYWGPLLVKPEDWTALDIIRKHMQGARTT